MVGYQKAKKAFRCLLVSIEYNVTDRQRDRRAPRYGIGHTVHCIAQQKITARTNRQTGTVSHTWTWEMMEHA